jgi:hypothetical protein
VSWFTGNWNFTDHGQKHIDDFLETAAAVPRRSWHLSQHEKTSLTALAGAATKEGFEGHTKPSSFSKE